MQHRRPDIIGSVFLLHFGRALPPETAEGTRMDRALSEPGSEGAGRSPSSTQDDTGLFRLGLSREEAEQLLILELSAPLQRRPENSSDEDPDSSEAALIWTSGDSEVLVEPAKTRLALRPGLVLVELRMVTDETGPGTLLLAFSIGDEPENAQLLAVVEDIPRGTAGLVSRWGETAQEIVWSAIRETALGSWRRRFPRRSLDLVGLYTDGNALSGVFAKPASPAQVLEYLRDPEAKDRPVFDPTPTDVGGPDDVDEAGCIPGLLSALFGRRSTPSGGGAS